MANKTKSPFKTKTVLKTKVNGVKIALKKYCLEESTNQVTGHITPERVFYYEVVGSDGSYFKCQKIEVAKERYNNLVDFERRQLSL